MLQNILDKEKISQVFSRFKGNKDELIPVMEAVQSEFGYLSKDAIQDISSFLKIPESNIYGVATFYALFRLKPSGKTIVRVCRGTACHVKGGNQILQEVETILGIKAGETSNDMEYSLETISCFGSCALSPVIVINDTVYGRVTPSKIKEILKVRQQQ